MQKLNRDMTRQKRKVSDRFKRFVEHWASKCRMLGMTSKKLERQTLTTGIITCEDEIKSKWDAIYGPDGLVEALLNNASKLIEIRFYLQYGDYLADSLLKYKDDMLKDSYWKSRNLDWVQVSQRLIVEEEEMAKWRAHGAMTQIPETPLISDIFYAGGKLGIPPSELTWEIHTYARRNLLCRSNIKHLINMCHWQSLAERTSRDLSSLHYAYPGRGEDQTEMRRTIKKFQAEFFEYVTCEDGEAIYVLTEKAIALSKSRMQLFRDRQRYTNKSREAESC